MGYGMALNLTAPINQLGYGNVCLNLLKAFEAIGEEPACWLIGDVGVLPEDVPLVHRAQSRADMFDGDAPSLRIWHQFDLAQHVGRGPKWAFPIFELDRFKTNELHHLIQQDGIIVASEWAKKVVVDALMEKYGECPRVVVAPFGVDHKLFSPANTSPKDGPTRFVNIGKWEYRKGHDVLCEAFNLAFSESDNVELFMHCHNPCFQDPAKYKAYNDDWNNLYASSPLAKKMFISQQRFQSQADVVALMASADCGVFPSRAEGWNLEVSEMLAMGKHIIVTDYSAHTEFCNQNSMLIPSRRPGRDGVDIEAAHDGVWFNADDPRWEGNPGGWLEFGEHQMNALVGAMQHVHRQKVAGVLGVNTAGIDSMKSFTWENCARKIVAAMKRD